MAEFDFSTFQKYPLDKIRTLVERNKVSNPVIYHTEDGFCFVFDVENTGEIQKSILIAMKSQDIRIIKTARTYIRMLNSIGINYYETIDIRSI